MEDLARRRLLGLGALLTCGIPLLGSTPSQAADRTEGQGAPDRQPAPGDREAAERARRISESVTVPTFPDAWFPITAHGAVGDGVTDCTGAIDRAIKDCHAAGGGHVLVPEGRWATGAIHLLSGVDLHVARGATLLFSTDPAAYLPVVRTRWQGVELFNYSPLIYADGQHDIAVTGRGVLDAQGDNGHWWFWVGSGQYGWQPGMPNQRADWAALERMGVEGVPVEERVFGAGHYLRPSFIQPRSCRNVLIEGVTLRRSPMWNIHPVLCREVTVRDVVVESVGPNGDGCDPDSCENVVIRRVTFATHDDCVAIKSGRDQDGWRVGVPSRNVLIEDCRYLGGGGAVAVGSEMSGGVENVVARRLWIPYDSSLDEASVAWILSVKSTSTRGGYIRDVHIADVACPAWTYVPFEVTFQYMGGTGGERYPEVSRLTARNWSVGGPCEIPFRIRAVPAAPVETVRLENLSFARAAKDPVMENATGVTVRDVLIGGSPYPTDTARTTQAGQLREAG
ncbi:MULTISPECIES: glycoside hydrolase family 28 protein [Streptomyces]|uniref:Glycoside hydrolase family 28 protein n=2 Tax=Streptomyces TaxID=1883 RepID=A0ABU2X8E2_9ACTN|nr:glycoside hydrolase family 28 protein [Streptomyces sp. DSM 41529]MDT0541815.1 glycoside hydrolase family 28 protein [Streptomyces sp. DSM 41529]